VFEFAVLAFAIFAKFVVVVPAAIATIPVTRTVVIIVIAVTVACVNGFCTFTIAFGATITLGGYFLNCGILAFTLFAELVIFAIATAVAFVPATFAVVVSVITGPVPNPGELHSLLCFTRSVVGARPLAAANTTCILFANAFALAVVTFLGQLARSVITLSIFVEITCFFIGAATDRGGGGGGGGGGGSGNWAFGGGGGGGGAGGSGGGEPDAGCFQTVRADREYTAIFFGTFVSICKHQDACF